MDTNKYKSVDARPVKRFFVEMLTRDIQIEDAILDLLDNCVDGILRSHPKQSKTPYEGFWAKITFNNGSFDLEDNCGGIPWDERNRAFRMGRPLDAANSTIPDSVGVYGIGMKRALFKIGKSSIVLTQNANDNYQVLFSEEWINDEDNWNVKVEANPTRMKEDGTHLSIQDLTTDVKEAFLGAKFEGDLIKKIASHYAVIIQKGFRVEVNNKTVKAEPIEIRFASQDGDGGTIRPYMFRSEVEGVSVFLAVGLRDPIPSSDRIDDEQEQVRFSSENAGWTVICNDRVVLFCDRSELTGWGILTVPRYHTQFIAISGIVEFHGDPTKLPTTTTKRGLKFESTLYQQVLMRMIEGMKEFTNFTNRWKTKAEEAERIVSPVPTVPYSEIKTTVQNMAIPFNSVKGRTGLDGERYMPKLPKPADVSKDSKIIYSRPKKDIVELGEKLLPDFEDIKEKDIPRSVGIASFEYAFKNLINK